MRPVCRVDVVPVASIAMRVVAGEFGGRRLVEPGRHVDAADHRSGARGDLQLARQRRSDRRRARRRPLRRQRRARHRGAVARRRALRVRRTRPRPRCGRWRPTSTRSTCGRGARSSPFDVFSVASSHRRRHRLRRPAVRVRRSGRGCSNSLTVDVRDRRVRPSHRRPPTVGSSGGASGTAAPP